MIGGELRAFLTAALVTRNSTIRPESPAVVRRRRLVVALAVIAGAAALGLTLAIRPGDPLFYAGSVAVAAIWGIGAFSSGPLYLGRARTRTGGLSLGILQGFLLGLIVVGVFLAGAVVVAQIPLLRGPVEGLLDHARYGSVWIVALITVLNGVAEELFFRGAVYAALERYKLIGSTALYAASTLFTGVPLLTFAAVFLGLLTAAQRGVTGGVLGPITSHLTFSLGMLFLLPPILTLGG
nr:CPBP family intramembrane metalloprotease [Actinomycetales bacterium]